ncbi:phosphoribosylamine--glycine ligase [Clostridia bacterium]|nr:phosphoribosylamine--glycine ligase [Clostridia bacterium]
MNILVVGSGGREHSISRKLLESKHTTQVFVAPGNDGMCLDEGIFTVAIQETDHQALLAFAKEKKIELVIIGSELPLLNGLADDFQKNQILVFGPSKKAALIEGSKDFAKQFMQKYQIPTAAFQTFSEYDLACAYIEEKGAPIVIKADGLAAGKGVTVAMTIEDARLALEEIMQEEKFGKYSKKVVIEEYLEGEEISLMAFVDGENVYPMEIAQDHKRAYDGEQGPNTGGMGAYSPVQHISRKYVEEAVEKILKPTAKGLVAEGRAFSGILYAGLMLTKDGVKTVEFNARFGDPETQVVLPRLESDLVEIILDVLQHRKPTIHFCQEGIDLGVVLASCGYPEKPHLGEQVTGLENLSSNTQVYYAGVKKDNQEKFVSQGGRVLLLHMRGKDMQMAREKLYTEMKKLDNPAFFYRKDIGEKAQR